jgi:hypothetical protein
MSTQRPGTGSQPDLLGRPPCGVGDRRGVLWSEQIIDPVAQLGELADLVDRGLLSRDEYLELKQRFIADLERAPHE